VLHTHNLGDWVHDHVIGQDQKRPGESRTLLIVAVTAIMMVVEDAAVQGIDRTRLARSGQ